jgi:uncharacterized membrane protein
MPDYAIALIFVTVLGCALVAGAFFAFSSFVMGALDRLPARESVAAMQSINVVVLTPAFMTALFGTALLCIAVAGVSLAHLGDADGRYALAGAVLYLVGTIGVTMAFNVSRNVALEKVDAAGPDAASAWRRYYGPWLTWNHVRTIAAAGATAAMVASLVS